MRAALAASLLALAAGCRHRHRRGAAAPAPAVGRWTATLPEVEALRVVEGHYLAGAVRRTDDAVAPPPYPAQPLVAAARVQGTWRFAAADGTLYAAEQFLGPLRVVASAPEGARPPGEALSRGVVRAVFQEGGLAYVGPSGRAWALDGSTLRPLALDHALAALFVSPRRVIALVEPGRLLRSEDGGRRFEEVPLGGADVPTAIALVRGATVVDSLHGRWALDEAGPPSPLRDGPDSLEASLRAGDLPPVAGAPVTALLPADPLRVAALADGTLAVLDGDAVALVDPRAQRTVRRVALPGQACGIAPGHGSYRLVCTHDGWARAVYAPDAAGGWRVLRDALRGDPMGDVVFDDGSEAFVVAAPCERGATPDATAFCAHGADGREVTVRAPFAGQPVDQHGGVALLVETGLASPARAALLRGSSLSTVTLPVNAHDARELRRSAGALAVWGRRDDGRPVLHRGAVDPSGAVRWTSHEAPAGAARGVLGGAGEAYALGHTAAELWRYRPGDGFARMPSPVRGSAASLHFDPEGLSYCAGPVCRLAGTLEWTAGAEGGPWFVTGARAVAAPPSWVTPPRRASERAHFACAWGAELGPAPLLERGAAVSGYTLQWEPHRDEVEVRWSGATLSQTTRARLPPTEERVTLAGVAPIGATSPVALLDRCAGSRCETFLATAAGVQPFPLEHFARGQRSALLLAEGGRVMALSRGASRGSTLAQATVFELPSASVVSQRAVASDAPAEAIHAGALDGADGLWLPTGARRWRFVPLAGAAPDFAVEDDGALAPCAAGAALRGVMRRLDGWSELRGGEWAPAEGGWQVEEVLGVTASGLCVRSIAGGESRDLTDVERHGDDGSPVRSFALTTDGAGSLRGEAWRGRRRVGLSCERVAARRTIAR